MKEKIWKVVIKDISGETKYHWGTALDYHRAAQAALAIENSIENNEPRMEKPYVDEVTCFGHKDF